jgi:iron complex outermembrane receptor protein
MPTRSASALGLLLGLGISVVASAEEEASLLTEADYFTSLPVVLSGSRLAQRLEASPVAITVLDRATIEASGARELQEVLRLVPGMVVGHHDGGIAFVSYHAFGDRFARRMQVLIDGRSVYTPALGGVDWSALPLALEDIERIEVIRGPNAAAYGANAFLGTINIISRRARPGALGRAVARHGERGVRDYVATVEHGGDGWGARLTASDWEDRGFVRTAAERRRDEKETRFMDARLDAGLGVGELLVQFGALEGERQAGWRPRAIDPDRLRTIAGDYQMLRWESAVNVDDSLAVQFYRVREDVDEVYSSRPIPRLGGAVIDFDYSTDSERIDLELQHRLRLTPDMRGVWGVSTRVDQVTSPSFFGSARARQEARLFRVFANGEWALAPTLTANAGLMLERSDLTGTDLSPRFALNWQTGPGRAWRTSISRAVRTPVLIEERADQAFAVHLGGTTYSDQALTSSGDLDSEQIVSWELGYLRTDAARRLTLDARLFYDDIRELITYHPVPFADTFPAADGVALDFRNHDAARVRGAEVSVDWRLDQLTRLRVNYSFADLWATDDDERYSTSAPRHIASAILTHSMPRADLSLMWYWHTTMHGMDALDRVPTQGRLDARLAFRLGTGPGAPRLALVGQALDGAYDDQRDGNRFDPRLVAELSVEF